MSATSTTSPTKLNDSKFNNYKDYLKYVNSTYSFAIPGLTNTYIGRDVKTMCPQGLVAAGDYILISAYDTNEDTTKSAYSVIYVLSNTDYKNRKFITTLVLKGTKTHAGGLAYDGTNVWVSGPDKHVHYIKYADIKKAANSGASYAEVNPIKILAPSNEKCSYLTYFKGKLWIGVFNQNAVDKIYGYEINNINNPTSLIVKNWMEAPQKTQGIAFREDIMMVSTSYGRATKSVLRVYEPLWNEPTSTGGIKKQTAKTTIDLPPGSQGTIIGATYTYVLFETAATKYLLGTDGKGKSDPALGYVAAFNTSNLINHKK